LQPLYHSTCVGWYLQLRSSISEILTDYSDYKQGDHLSGKPGNVGKFGSCSKKLSVVYFKFRATGVFIRLLWAFVTILKDISAD